MGSEIRTYPFVFRGAELELVKDINTCTGDSSFSIVKADSDPDSWIWERLGNPVTFRKEDLPTLLKAIRRQTPLFREAQNDPSSFHDCLTKLGWLVERMEDGTSRAST